MRAVSDMLVEIAAALIAVEEGRRHNCDHGDVTIMLRSDPEFFVPVQLIDTFIISYSLTAPKDPPRNVVINRTTSNSITLSWDPPLEPNGVIEGYDVRYYERESPNKLNIDDNVKRRVHTISDLEPWRYYRILVACQSSGGLGPYSESVEQRTDPGGRVLFACLFVWLVGLCFIYTVICEQCHLFLRWTTCACDKGNVTLVFCIAATVISVFSFKNVLGSPFSLGFNLFISFF